jgi:hypothetical protein
MTMLRAFWDAALELDPAAPDEGRTMRWCSTDELASLWKAAGLCEVEVGELVVSAAYDDFDDYWSPFLGGQGPAPSYCVRLPEAHRAELRERLRSTLPIDPDGPISLAARAFAIRSRVPAAMS